MVLTSLNSHKSWTWRTWAQKNQTQINLHKYIFALFSLSSQWLLIFSKKKKKINGWPLTPILLQQSLSKPQTQPWPTIHNSSPPLQHHLRWWFSSSNLPLTGISILTRSQLKHLPLSSIFRNLKELKLPSSFAANPSYLSTSLPDLSEPNSQTHSSGLM